MTLDLARWQLVVMRISRFFLVPATIGQAFLIAFPQAGRYRGRGVFGAALAMWGLPAFLLESAFPGLRGYCWDKLSRPVHPAALLVAGLAGVLSVAFIRAPALRVVAEVAGRPGCAGVPGSWGWMRRAASCGAACR